MWYDPVFKVFTINGEEVSRPIAAFRNAGSSVSWPFAVEEMVRNEKLVDLASRCERDVLYRRFSSFTQSLRGGVVYRSCSSFSQ